jgi:hypothetical protein
VLAALASVAENQRSSPPFDSAVSILAHLAAARQLWLTRLGVAEELPREIFPRGLALPEVAARVESVQRAWSDYLSQLKDADLALVSPTFTVRVK